MPEKGDYKFWLTFGINIDRPELLKNQYSAIPRQITILYSILLIVSINIFFVSFGKVPSFLTIGVAPLVCILCIIRGISWHRKRFIPNFSPEAIYYILIRTVAIGIFVALLFTIWAMAIFYYANEPLRVNIAVFVSITTFGCAFCMMQIPVAAVWLALVVFFPTTSIFVLTGSPTLISVSITSTAIYITLIFSLFSYFENFSDAVEAKVRSQAQAVEIAHLHSKTIAAEKQRLQDRNADMERIADAFTDSIAGVTYVVSDVATQSSMQSHKVASCSDEALQHLEHLTLAADFAQKALESVDASTISLFKAIESIKNRMAQCSAMSMTLGARTDSADNAMQTLDGAVGKIDDIAKMIKTIADQINLIALNATIEAARAGTSGRGFAVVASEIKVLADRTAHAIGDVGRLIENVKTASHDAKSSVIATKDAFVQFRDVSEDVSGALKIQSAVTVDIRRSVEKAVDSAAVMQADLTQMGQSAEQTHRSAKDMLNRCEVLQTEMNVLEREVNKFVEFIKVTETDMSESASEKD